jgi:hypothetical protein
LPDRDPEIETFMQTAKQQQTNDVSTTVHNVLACERYFFRIGCGTDTCPLSDVYYLVTQNGK